MLYTHVHVRSTYACTHVLTFIHQLDEVYVYGSMYVSCKLVHTFNLLMLDILCCDVHTV